MTEDNPIRVQLIKNCVSVTLVTRSEYYDFPFFGHFFEEGERVGPNCKIDLNGFFVDLYVQSQIGLALIVLKAVDEGFVEVKDQGFGLGLADFFGDMDGGLMPMLVKLVEECFAGVEDRDGGANMLDGEGVLFVARADGFSDVVLVIFT